MNARSEGKTMKTSLALALGFFAITSTFAQGTINFFNNNLTGPDGVYRAGIFVDEGMGPGGIPRIVGAGVATGAPYTVGLFLASNLTTPLATTTFRTTTAPEVFIATVPDVQVTGVGPNQVANLVVRAWQT